jgi:hypothetical protein
VSKLPYKLECKSASPCYELIAAFNCKDAAMNYAIACARSNVTYSYRVKHGRTLLQEIEPAED